jgi:hypothetical protein
MDSKPCEETKVDRARTVVTDLRIAIAERRRNTWTSEGRVSPHRHDKSSRSEVVRLQVIVI